MVKISYGAAEGAAGSARRSPNLVLAFALIAAALVACVGIITYAKSTNALAPVETFQMTKLGTEYMVRGAVMPATGGGGVLGGVTATGRMLRSVCRERPVGVTGCSGCARDYGPSARRGWGEGMGGRRGEVRYNSPPRRRGVGDCTTPRSGGSAGCGVHRGLSAAALGATLSEQTLSDSVAPGAPGPLDMPRGCAMLKIKSVELFLAETA